MKKDLNITNDLKTNYSINTGKKKSVIDPSVKIEPSNYELRVALVTLIRILKRKDLTNKERERLDAAIKIYGKNVQPEDILR